MNGLVEFNLQTGTWIDLLQERAALQPDQVAYYFLTDGQEETVSMTYTELNRKARAIAAHLQAMNAHGERALLLYPSGLDYVASFFGCLYAGVIAVPAYPPHPKKPAPRIHSIVADANAKFALTTSKIYADLQARFDEAPDLAAIHWLVTDETMDGIESSWKEPVVTADTLAFLQYTSGSTSAPKGVMLSHRNLLLNTSCIQQSFELTEASRGMVWLPPFHDMGLIGGILAPLFKGFPVTIMAPFDFLQRPLRWLQTISRIGATVSGGPNFAYDLCVKKITPEQRDQLDLSTWGLAFNGAEPIHPETIERFSDYFAPAGFRKEAFYPCYGLAESSLIVTGGFKSAVPILRSFDSVKLEQHEAIEVPAGTPGSKVLVGSGHAVDQHRVLIVDPEMKLPVKNGTVGEICVVGPCVAKGYWNQSEKSAETFVDTLGDIQEGPILRTGDLGFLQDQELFVTGRIKDLLVIRGRNHYPQDLEGTAERCHEAVRFGCSAAFSIEKNGEERLVLVAELERTFRPRKTDQQAEEANVALKKSIVTAIRKGIAEEHELQVYDVVLLKTNALPKTSSGKVQRHQCKIQYLNETLESWG